MARVRLKVLRGRNASKRIEWHFPGMRFSKGDCSSSLGHTNAWTANFSQYSTTDCRSKIWVMTIQFQTVKQAWQTIPRRCISSGPPNLADPILWACRTPCPRDRSLLSVSIPLSESHWKISAFLAPVRRMSTWLIRRETKPYNEWALYTSLNKSFVLFG